MRSLLRICRIDRRNDKPKPWIFSRLSALAQKQQKIFFLQIKY